MDFPTIAVTATLPGRRSGDHGLGGRHAAGEPVLHHRRDRFDDLDQQPGHDPHHPAVLPRPQYRRRGPGRAVGDRRRRCANCRRPARSAEHAQGEPLGFADPVPGAELAHLAAAAGRRICRDDAGPAIVEPAGRCPGECLRLAEIRRAHPAQSRCARRSRHRHRRGPGRSASRQCQSADRQPRGLQGAQNRSGPTASSSMPRPSASRSSPIATALRCASATSAPSLRQRRERQGRELVQRRPRRRAGHPAPAGLEHHRGGRRDPRACCRASRRSCPRPSI